MSRAEVWAIVLVMGGLTFALRASFLLLGERLTLPGGLARALRFVPAAVLAALVLPAVVAPEGQLAFGDPRLLAGAVAALVAWRTRAVLPTLLVGMALLWGLGAIGLG